MDDLKLKAIESESAGPAPEATGKPRKPAQWPYIVIIAMFLVPIFFFGIYSMVDADADFSDKENRMLATMPTLVLDGAVNQSFQAEYNAFYNDTFPFRDLLIDMNKNLRGLYSHDFLRGEDDAVFVLVDGGGVAGGVDVPTTPDTTVTAATDGPDASGTTAPDTTQPSQEEQNANFAQVPIVNGRAFEVYEYKQNVAASYVDVINKLYEQCGVDTYVIMAPSASDLYFPDKYRMPKNEQRQAFDYIKQNLNGPVAVDVYDAFHQNKDDYIFFKSDHHWTARGAYLAYEALGAAAGFAPVPLTDMQTGRLDGFLGSLYKMIASHGQSAELEKSPDYVEYFYPLYGTTVINYENERMKNGEERQVLYPDYDRNTNVYNVFYGGDMMLMYMHSEVNNGRSVMVVRDSYGHAMLPYLANNYEHVYAVEPRYYESFPLAGFIKEKNIDSLVFVNYSIPATGGYWLPWPPELEKLLNA